MPSGEMVAPMIDSFLRDKPRALPAQPPEHGPVPRPAGRRRRRVDVHRRRPTGLRGRDHGARAAALTEWLRRIVASQETTVEAAITGDRDTAVDAMLLDPLAGRIDFDHVEQMTDEMLAATAQWLPQFA